MGENNLKRVLKEQRTIDLIFWGLVILTVLLVNFIPPKRHSIIIILAVVAWCFQGHFKSRIKNAIHFVPWLFLPGLYFILMVVSLLYSANHEHGMRILEQTVSLLIIPLMLGFQGFEQIKLWFPILLLSLAANVFMLDGIFAYKLFVNWSEIDLSSPTPQEPFVPVHIAYFGFQNAFLSLFFLIGPSINLRKYFRLGIAAFFGVFVVLIGAKTPLLAYGFLLTIATFLLMASRYKSMGVLGKIGLGAVPLLLIVLAIATPSTRIRFEQVIDRGWRMPEPHKPQTGLTLRILKWDCSRELISESFWGGHGIGDEQDLLNECYRSREFWGHAHNFNSHNQYLQAHLAIGVLGPIILLAIFFGPLFSRKIRQFLPLGFFLVLFGICIITESMLYRHPAVILFSVFYPLLLWMAVGEGQRIGVHEQVIGNKRS